MRLAALRRRQRVAIVASAARMRTRQDAGQAPGKPRRGGEEWQLRALAYYDAVGEVKYAAQFYAKMLAALRLYVAYEEDDGELREVGAPITTQQVNADGETEDVEVQPTPLDVEIAGVITRIRGERGGRAELQAQYGRLRFLCGECYLVCRIDDDGAESWHVWSVEELKPKGDGVYEHIIGPGSTEELVEAESEEDPVPGQCVVYRLWQPHPRYSQRADAPLKGVLDVCEELLLLSLSVRAKARSRAAGPGLLYVPLELDLPVRGALTGTQTFMDDLTASLTAPLEDEGSAASVAPMIMRGPAQIGSVPASQAIFKLSLQPEGESYPEQPKIEQAIRRLALSLDMPPEELLGKQDSNHWSAWQVGEETWRGHGLPVATTFCDELTSAYLRPELASMGIDADEVERYRVWFDESRVVNHPDRGRDAKDLHAVFALSDASLREATGFDDGDAPSQEEREQRVLEQAAARGRLAGDQPVADAGEPTTGDDPGAVEPGAPDAEATARILGATELAVLRAREAAGARLRQRLRKDTSLLLRTADVPNDRLAAVVGAAQVAALANGDAARFTPDQLVSGSTDVLRSQLLRWGVEAGLARALTTVVEQHAAETLYDDDPPLLTATIRERAGAARG